MWKRKKCDGKLYALKIYCNFVLKCASCNLSLKEHSSHQWERNEHNNKCRKQRMKIFINVNT